MSGVETKLRTLEESLWHPLTRFDSAYMESVLAEDFVEFGRSGRVYSREDVIRIPVGEFVARLPLPEFEVRMVTDDVALVTYRTEVRYASETRTSNRMSVWRRDPVLGWQLEFHQGTPSDE
jgi:hypothetical protein